MGHCSSSIFTSRWGVHLVRGWWCGQPWDLLLVLLLLPEFESFIWPRAICSTPTWYKLLSFTWTSKISDGTITGLGSFMLKETLNRFGLGNGFLAWSFASPTTKPGFIPLVPHLHWSSGGNTVSSALSCLLHALLELPQPSCSCFGALLVLICQFDPVRCRRSLNGDSRWHSLNPHSTSSRTVGLDAREEVEESGEEPLKARLCLSSPGWQLGLLWGSTTDRIDILVLEAALCFGCGVSLCSACLLGRSLKALSSVVYPYQCVQVLWLSTALPCWLLPPRQLPCARQNCCSVLSPGFILCYFK